MRKIVFKVDYGKIKEAANSFIKRLHDIYLIYWYSYRQNIKQKEIYALILGIN